MEKSELYDLLENKFLREWKEKANDDCGFMQEEKDLLEKLKAELDEKNKKLLASYALAIEDRMDLFYYNLNIKFLNFGIKFGMDLQKAFAEYE